MDINLHLVDEGGGKVTAHAAVVNDDGGPQKGVSVTFRANGKDTGRPVRVDDDGVATKELTLKASVEYHIVATVVGKLHVTDGGHITPQAKKRRPTHWIEWVFSGIFLILVLKFGYTTLAVVGLIITMLVLLVGSIVDDEDTGEAFLQKLVNNNWVYWMMFWLTVSPFVIWLLSLTSQPLPDFNPLNYAWGKIKDVVTSAPTDPYAEDGYGTSITRFLLGNEGGWFKAALSNLLWLPFAYVTSFWDDWVDKMKADKGKGGWVKRALKFLLEDLMSSKILKFLGWD